jgi:hypothetical protein
VAKTPITALAAAVIMAAAIRVEGKQGVGDLPTVFIHIDNSAAVPPETIRAARREIAHVFDAAGVRIESSVAEDHDRCGLHLTIHVTLLGGAAADRFVRAGRIERKVLAQANSAARRVYVLWERVGPAVDRHAVGHGDALGLVIAHELGHVLLPGRGHSGTGIMQADYNVRLSYRLKFSDEEAAAMRTVIRAAQGAKPL